VFTPLDLQLLPNVSVHQNKGLQVRERVRERVSNTLLSSTNVSLTTSAIKGRLQCENFPSADATWLGLESPHQFRDWIDSYVSDLVPDSNITHGYFLPSFFGWGTTSQTSVLSSYSRPICCENKTASDTNAQSAIGYWSQWNDYVNYILPENISAWSGNFSAKWIVGTTNTTKFSSHFITKDAIDTSSTYKFMYFTQEPRLRVLNCQTSIEQVEDYVTVARQSGNVLDFNLVDEPRSIDDPWVTAYASNPPENVEDLKGYDRGGRNIR
jgi:hypothetical protein